MDRSLVFAAVLAGCSPLLGLDKPVLVDAIGDTDGDTILDNVDNCPLISNPQQQDTDADGIGDACDDCLALALRATDDQDHDAVVDTMDTCVGLPGSQMDTDGDGIGDVCDPHVGADRSCAFTFRDAGGSEPADFWSTTWQLTGWQVSGGKLSAGGASIARDAFTSGEYGPGSLGIAIESSGSVESYSDPLTIGIVAASTTLVRYTCTVRETTAGEPFLELGAGNAMRTMAITSQLTLGGSTRLAFIKQGGTVIVRCELLTGSTSTAMVEANDVVTDIPTLHAGMTTTNAAAAIEDVIVYRLGD